MKPPKIVSPSFDALVREMMAADPGLQLLLRPLVIATERLDELVAELNHTIRTAAKHCSICQTLMSVPGVGPLVAFAFVSGVDDPRRFDRSRTVGAHFGLTPRRYQSGETDWAGRISRAGDAAVRRALYQAANVLIHRSGRWCALKSWAVRLAKRRGLGKAKVALARKLAVVLHKMWVTGELYRWQAAISV
ncbi:MAG: transposase [Actinomycetota bacterium]|nr:transposase [Actinomycetota bacterium]